MNEWIYFTHGLTECRIREDGSDCQRKTKDGFWYSNRNPNIQGAGKKAIRERTDSSDQTSAYHE